jgi:steroid 5-alpha reductase family enzyme
MKQMLLILSLLGVASSFLTTQHLVHRQNPIAFQNESLVQPSSFGVSVKTSNFERRGPILKASPILLPSLQTIAIACLAPTSLGFIRYEYGVSYGYGISVALVAYLILKQLSSGTVAYWHALALLFYGVRLNLFLLYRETCIPRFRAFRERIEVRRGGKNRLLRLPFVVGCAALYACLASPLLITSQVTTVSPFFKACVVTSWVGFVIAALGDLQKSFVKAMLGPDVLVKGGIFTRLRHPNYTGEILAWTASFMASVVVAVADWKQCYAVPLVASAIGWIGIVGVLAMGATGLEQKQKEKYVYTPGYDSWVKKSWAGPTLPKNQSNENQDTYPRREIERE